METANNKKLMPHINEALMMDLMVDGVKKEGLQISDEITKEPEESAEEKSVQKEKNRQKKTTGLGYSERFLNNHTMTKRGDKSIYIRQEHHERMTRIVQVMGKDKIPLYAYLDNILEHHFELFEKGITNDFNENFKPIF